LRWASRCEHAHRGGEVQHEEIIRIAELLGDLDATRAVGREHAGGLQLLERDVVHEGDDIGLRPRALGDGTLGDRPGGA
jgi:hypothetical protein